MNPMLQLTVESLCKRYGPRPVLSDLNLEARAGSVLVITGPNGVGKSTLLRCLSGLERPSSGSVRWLEDGIEWDAARRRSRLGYLSPEMALYEALTGMENLLFFGRLLGMPNDRQALYMLLDRVGLAGRDNDLVSGYSSGMKQRLKWAFALQGEPDALVLDEPGITLDKDGFQLSGELVASCRERGAVVVLATNDTREIDLGDERVDLG